MSWLAIVVVSIGVLYSIMVYNSLVTVRTNISKAWSNIDVLLKQRHDELPKLVDTCRQYMQHEQSTLERVIQSRSNVHAAQEARDVNALGQAEESLRVGLGQLFALAENYPDLKADRQFAHLQKRITELENALADRREFYNDSVYLNNVRVQHFPELIVAKVAGFHQADMLKFSSAELQDVDIAARFNH